MKLIDLFEDRSKTFPHTRLNGDKWDYDDEDIVNWCKKYASEYLKNPTPIFRGDPNGRDAIYHTKDLERKSKNTLNYYTIWMDNHPQWSAYPKRGKSLICTTSSGTANGYSDNVFRVIPSNECRVGVVPSRDLWFAFEPLRSFFKNSGLSKYKTSSMDGMATGLDGILSDILQQGRFSSDEDADSIYNWVSGTNPLEKDWPKLKDALKEITTELILDSVSANRGHESQWDIKKLRAYTVLAKRMDREGFDNLYDALDSLMDPSTNGFKVVSPGHVPGTSNIELWIGGGDCLLIKDSPSRHALFKSLGIEGDGPPRHPEPNYG